MKTLAMVMRKGGSGKTTSALNLAHAFGLSGKKVLFLDLDDQKNASGVLSDDTSPPEVSIQELLLDPAVSIASVVRESSWEGVSYIPASGNLSGVIRELDGEVGSHMVLKEKLQGAHYDVCFIDTSPSLNILVVNALCAADYLFIPLSSNYFSLQGLPQTLGAYEKVKSRLNRNLSVAGLGFVIHDKRSVLSREVVERARKEYGHLVFDTVVGQNIRIEEAHVKGLSIFSYEPAGRGALQYRMLSEELAERMGGLG